MAPRIFTLAEARAILPQIRALLHAAQEARSELVRRGPDVLEVNRKAGTNGGSHEASAALPAFTQMEAGIQSIVAMGVHVKDVERGLIDFPARREGRIVYLCWQYGEDDIAYWHEVNAGYAGRQPVDDQFE